MFLDTSPSASGSTFIDGGATGFREPLAPRVLAAIG
jgi:hypothetical protein